MLLRLHPARCELAAYECGTYTTVEHRIPPPRRLFPERRGPRELATIDHTFVTAPRGIDEDVDALFASKYVVEYGGRVGIVRVIAAERLSSIRIWRIGCKRTSRHLDAGARLDQDVSDAFADTERCAGYERDRAGQRRRRHHLRPRSRSSIIETFCCISASFFCSSLRSSSSCAAAYWSLSTA